VKRPVSTSDAYILTVAVTLSLTVPAELQNGYSQSVLYHALSITTLSSRPLRNLPKLQYVRTVRRSLYLLYWRLQAHYSSTKEEYRMRQAERRGMFLQVLQQICTASVRFSAQTRSSM
jgi:hypothetical protein